MAESCDHSAEALEVFVSHVCNVIPGITPDLLKELLDYLESAGVHSKDDIGKVDESELAIVVGPKNAMKLMEYFKNQDSMKMDPPSFSTAKSALDIDYPEPRGMSYRCGEEVASTDSDISLDIDVSEPKVSSRPHGNVPQRKAKRSSDVDLPDTSRAVSHRQDKGLQNGNELFQMVMMVQKMEGQKNQEILEMQKKTFDVVTEQMKAMTTMQNRMLDKMSEQMTEQTKLHKDTITTMTDHMNTTAAMHGETLRAVQHGLTEAQRMTSETLEHMATTMGSTCEMQEKNMAEIRKMLAEDRNRTCAVM
ncbi:uncharacterized protein LOC144149431 isoform X1 [Haemaphysalis longicornis]